MTQYASTATQEDFRVPRFQIDLLDVGAIEYGDSILIQAGGLTALIDGGKRASGRATTAQVLGETVRHAPLDQQISSILNGATPLDLLVVTHCHSDHIGCLPQLFSEGRLRTRWALLADPQLGYGITQDQDLLPDAAEMTAAQKLRLALREEPALTSDPAEIREFIEDSAQEYSEYLDFVKSLRESLGDQCVEYRGPDEEQSPGLTALLAAMAPMDLQIYGPSLIQLVRCAGFLEGRSDDVDSAIGAALQQSGGDVARAYIALRPLPADFDGEGETDQGENGNAVNNQSLVLSVSDGTRRVLLTGDMQFARPQLADDELRAEMKTLQDAVLAAAPYAFVKLSHHGATNGQNLSLLRKLGAKLFGISTGSRSSKHPTAPTLSALQSLKEESGAQWVRVDINGRCGYRVANGQGSLTVERNDLDDTTPPAERAGDEAVTTPAASSAGTSPTGIAAPLITREIRSDDGGVEVIIRIPRSGAKVSLQLEVEPLGPLS